MTEKFKELVRILGAETVLNAVMGSLLEKCVDKIADRIAEEYNISFDSYDYHIDEVFTKLSDDDKKLIEDETVVLNSYDCLKNREWITDSTYYDIGDEFASRHNFEFDDDEGWPDIVYTFENIAWKIIHNTKYI